MWQLLERVVGVAGRLPGYIVTLITLVVGVDVVMRSFGVGTIDWIIEVVEYLLYVATFLGAPYLLLRKGHVTVDTVVNSLRPRAAAVLGVVTAVLVVLITAILTWAALLATLRAAAENSTLYKNIAMPEWALLALLPVSFAALTLVGLRLLHLSLRAARHGASSRDERQI